MKTNEMQNSGMSYAESGELAAELIWDGESGTAVSQDFILPDYMPDAARLLRVTARTEEDGEKIESVSVGRFGSVIFTALYMDDGGKLRSVAFSTDYNIAQEIPGLDDGDTVLMTESIDEVTGSLPNPRKMSLKCRLTLRIKAYKTRKLTPELSGIRGVEDELSLERDKTEVPSMTVRREESGNLRGSYDAELDAAQPMISGIILCELDINSISCTADNGMLSYNGEGCLRCLYETADGGCAAVTRKFPVNAELALGLRGSCVCTANAKTGELNASVELNGYGEPRIIQLDYSYKIEASVFYMANAKLTRDIYSTEYDCKPVSGRCVLRSPARNCETNFSVNAVKPRAELEGSDGGSLILPVMSDANVVITDMKLDEKRNRLIAEGNADIYMLALARNAAKSSAVVEYGDETVPDSTPDETYTAVTFSVPVKCELDAGGIKSGFGWQCEAGVSGVRGRFDSANVYADFEVSLNLSTENTGTYDYITAAVLDTTTRAPRPAASIVLYYPESGEMLWDIAKKYGTTRRELAEANGIGETDALPRVLRVPMPEKRQAVLERVI